MTKSRACKIIPRFHEFIAKSCLVDADGCQANGHVVRNRNNILNAEITNNDDVNSIDTCTPTWDDNMKDHVCVENHNCAGCRSSHFELIALRFNLKDTSSDFFLIGTQNDTREMMKDLR